MPDGAYLAVGSTGSFGVGGDNYVLKIAADGSLDWSTFFGNQGSESLRAIASCDSGFLLVGTTNSLGNGGYDMLVVRIDTMGTFKWSRTWGGSAWDFANDAVFSDGVWTVVGESYSFSGTSSDGVIVRFDDDGNEVWSTPIGLPEDDCLNSVDNGLNGNVLVVGRTISVGGYPIGLIASLNSGGALLWTATTAGDSTEVLMGCLFSVDGQAIAVGHTFSNGQDAQVLLVSYDPLGAENWTRTIGQSGDFMGAAIVQRPDSGFAIAGSVAGFGGGGTDAYLLFADQEGNVEQGYTFGDTEDECAWAIVRSSSGGYVLAGSTKSYGNGTEDIHLISVDSSGTTQGAPVTVQFDQVDVPERSISSGPLVRPNPVGGFDCFTIGSTGMESIQSLSMVDASGRSVQQWSTDGMGQVCLEGFEPGTYKMLMSDRDGKQIVAVFVVL